MDIKLIVTDLDRTLLHTDKALSAYTVAVLARCRAAGFKLAFATARNERGVVQFTEMLDASPDALILRNGAEVYIEGDCHARHGISPAARDQILQALTRAFPAATLSVEIDGVLYGNDNLFRKWHNVDVIHTDFSDLPPKPAAVIIVGAASMADIEAYAAYIPADLYIEMSSGENQHLCFIMIRKATKWTGVETVAAHYKIPAAQVLAIGDDYNDISMLKNCGTGIAVANAIPEAKAAADHICDTNNNDGPAKWLEENLL